MEKLDKVELVREKCNVSYEKARAALEACDYDVLDAIVALEQEEAKNMNTTTFESVPEERDVAETLVTYEVGPQAEGAQGASEAPRETRTQRFGRVWQRFCNQCKRIIRAGLDMTFIAERNGEEVFAIPVLLLVIGLLAWGAALWLMIVGLFFGFRYRIDGASALTVDFNAAMDKAANVADNIKHDLA